MRTQDKYVYSLSLSSLLCACYTLTENHKIFKQLILKNELYFNKSQSAESSDSITEFQDLVNSPGLRRLAYILLKPLLKRNDPFLSSNQTINKEIWNETILLKKYLRKFKHHYMKFFFFHNRRSGDMLTEKEINSSALKNLFLLAGI